MTRNSNRRETDRLEVLLPVDYYVDRGYLHKFHLASNISVGGAFINTSNALKIGEEVDVIVSLFDDFEPEAPPRRFVMHGQVRHVRQSQSQTNGSVTGMGVQWLDMTSSTWDEIKSIVVRQMGGDPIADAPHANS
jgi:Tfp pilus assembly protein PilZ